MKVSRNHLIETIISKMIDRNEIEIDKNRKSEDEDYIHFTEHQKVASKVIISVDNDYYMFSRKRSIYDPSKDDKLELLGGNFCFENDKTLFDTLIRELSEEEKSGYLAKTIKEKAKEMESIVLQGRNGFQLYKIYTLEIKMNDYEKIKDNFCREESYGFVLKEKKIIENRDMFSANKYIFTSKTIKLFSSLLFTDYK
jgi:hypothetical protein